MSAPASALLPPPRPCPSSPPYIQSTATDTTPLSVSMHLAAAPMPMLMPPCRLCGWLPLIHQQLLPSGAETDRYEATGRSIQGNWWILCEKRVQYRKRKCEEETIGQGVFMVIGRKEGMAGAGIGLE